MIDEETIKNEILQGLLQVDSSFVITEFSIIHDKSTRHLSVSFIAQKGNGETISEVINYA